MDISSLVHPGQTREEAFLVEEEHSALTVGSGSARVLATPWMIAFAERTAYRLLAELLPAGSSSDYWRGEFARLVRLASAQMPAQASRD